MPRENPTKVDQKIDAVEAELRKAAENGNVQKREIDEVVPDFDELQNLIKSEQKEVVLGSRQELLDLRKTVQATKEETEDLTIKKQVEATLEREMQETETMFQEKTETPATEAIPTELKERFKGVSGKFGEIMKMAAEFFAQMREMFSDMGIDFLQFLADMNIMGSGSFFRNLMKSEKVVLKSRLNELGIQIEPIDPTDAGRNKSLERQAYGKLKTAYSKECLDRLKEEKAKYDAETLAQKAAPATAPVAATATPAVAPAVAPVRKPPTIADIRTEYAYETFLGERIDGNPGLTTGIKSLTVEVLVEKMLSYNPRQIVAPPAVKPPTQTPPEIVAAQGT